MGKDWCGWQNVDIVVGFDRFGWLNGVCDYEVFYYGFGYVVDSWFGQNVVCDISMYFGCVVFQNNFSCFV